MLVDRLSSLPRATYVGLDVAPGASSDSEALTVMSESRYLPIGCFCGFDGEFLTELNEKSTPEDVYGFVLYSSEAEALRSGIKVVPNGHIASVLRVDNYFLVCPFVSKVDEDYTDDGTVKIIVWSKNHHFYPPGSIILSNILETEDYKAIKISGQIKVLND